MIIHLICDILFIWNQLYAIIYSQYNAKSIDDSCMQSQSKQIFINQLQKNFKIRINSKLTKSKFCFIQSMTNYDSNHYLKDRHQYMQYRARLDR